MRVGRKEGDAPTEESGSASKGGQGMGELARKGVWVEAARHFFPL